MGDALACLRGWHPALASAELAALLPDAVLTATACPRWVQVDQSTEAERAGALAVAAGLQAFLLHGETVAWTGEAAPLLDAVAAYLERHPVGGTVRVQAWRQDQRIPGVSTRVLAASIGELMVGRGWTVDLHDAHHVLALVADGPTATLAFGWMEGGGPAPFEHRARQATQRPFFKPVSLDPKLARLVVNLAGGPVGCGPVVDPMTGTGGFVIEASLSGRAVLGLDIHSEMVAGATANLAWAHDDDVPADASIRRGDATRIEDALPEGWHGEVAGFVLDPPYGRNSHGTQGAMPLLVNTLASARRAVKPNGAFVLILPVEPMGERLNGDVPFDEAVLPLHGDWPDLLNLIRNEGWQPVHAHVERVHRSLSRLILLARCAPQG